MTIKSLFFILLACTQLPLNAYRRYVLTGGPGVGKSTVISELAKRGYAVAPEAYTLLHNRAEKEQSLDTLLADPVKFRSKLMEEQLKIESRLNPEKSAFLDRSAIDVVAFGDHFKVEMSKELRDEANRKYDLIFFLDPLPAKYYENTKVRRETPEEAELIHNDLKKAYKDRGYHPYQLIDVPFGTPEFRAQYMLDAIARVYFFADVIDCFAGKNSLYKVQEFIGPVKLIQFKDKTGQPYHFFGVEQDKQTQVPFAKFKAKVAELMRVSPAKMIEIVGDSFQFSEQGSNYVRKYLRELFAGNHIIGYGYTGYIKGKELDINSFLNEYLDEHPKEAYKVLANILGHTHMALNQWHGVRGSGQVRNFVVVYNSDGMTKEPAYNKEGVKTSGFTTFGDDIVISDHVLQPKEGDRIVCVEGGVQSFRQVMNALALNVPVDLIYNVRVPGRETFFSTARFLAKIKADFTDGQAPSPKAVRDIYDGYIATLESIWDTSKGDHKTKQALFDTAIDDFINKGIYLHINKLCSFKDAGFTSIK